MMGKEDYATTGGTLKLKGVKDSKVEKKKKKKKPKPETETEDTEKQPTSNKHEGNEVEDPTRETDQDAMALDVAFVGKTEAERRHEEMRRQRLAERLRREGVKTHKERVEELNKYLSNLSEHHDMPRIGPG